MDTVNVVRKSIHCTTVMILLKDTKKAQVPVKVDVCQEPKSGLIIVKIPLLPLMFLRAKVPIGTTRIFNMTIMEVECLRSGDT